MFASSKLLKTHILVTLLYAQCHPPLYLVKTNSLQIYLERLKMGYISGQTQKSLLLISAFRGEVKRQEILHLSTYLTNKIFAKKKNHLYRVSRVCHKYLTPNLKKRGPDCIKVQRDFVLFLLEGQEHFSFFVKFRCLSRRGTIQVRNPKSRLN